jgi:uncharacterized membrane protein
MNRAAEGAPTRYQALDLVRGVVMALMALDHVRVYSGQPAGGPTAGIFFTRWVTHFCAPAFAFFAGTSAFLHGRKLGDARALAKFLVVRGAWLVVLELTLVRASWTFNLDYASFTLAGVLWMLGWCMILLAPLVLLRTRTIAIVGLSLMFAQQVFGLVPRALPADVQSTVAPLWNFVYPSGAEGWSGISILYVLVPWIGVVASGYAFGAIVVRDQVERRRLCLRIGLLATAAFVVIAAAIELNSPAPDELPRLFRALNPAKYPASQLFLLMTLGPTIALLPLAERARGWFAKAIATIGRVPLFYYLLHIPVIHIVALVVMQLREGELHPEWYATAPYSQVPPDHRWSLPLLYLVFALVIVVLYFPCRWFAAFKARRRDPWLSYL